MAEALTGYSSGFRADAGAKRSGRKRLPAFRWSLPSPGWGGLPEAAPALLCGTPTLPVGQREFQAEVPLDLPSLAAGAVHLVDVAVAGARQGDRAEASLAPRHASSN